jgi:hypothetical protein
MGHNVSRLDPARIGTPYHPMQVGPAYISPSPQPVTGGKFNHVVYVHPFSQVSNATVLFLLIAQVELCESKMMN